MKTRLVLVDMLGIILIAALTKAQAPSQEAIHKVPAGSQKNQLVLTVANESKTQGADAVKVLATRVPSGISLPSRAQTIKILSARQETDCTFLFDVARSVKIGSNDTLEFRVQDRSGSSWMKNIIVQFTGPTNYNLEQNFPNPFNPSTTIYYDLPLDSRVSIIVYDILGREVTRLVDEVKQAGFYDIPFDAGGLASGAYFYRMQAEPLAGGKHFAEVKKLLVLK